MVQLGSPEPTEHDKAAHASDANPLKDSWSDVVRKAASDFSQMVTDSSQQLVAAAEKLTSDSLGVAGDLAQKAEQASSKSSEMAAVATQAAAETRRLADSIQTTINQATTKALEETKATLGEPARQAEQALRASEQVRADLQQKLDDAIRRVEVSASAGREAAAKAEQAAEESRVAAVEASSRAERAQLAVAEQDSGDRERLRGDLQGKIEGLSLRLDEFATTSRESTARSETIANEAKQAAIEAIADAKRTQAATVSAVDPVAQEVLERLEADYSLLTKLVQELHARIATLSGQAPGLAAASRVPSEFETSTVLETIDDATQDKTPYSIEQPPTLETHRSWHPGGDHIASTEVEGEDENAHRSAVEEEGCAGSPTIGGRILVSISPVPDFDRLLNLDGALGRMPGIENVTLADYAKEEVTF